MYVSDNGDLDERFSSESQFVSDRYREIITGY